MSRRPLRALFVEHAAQNPGAYDTALVFSTKWVPPPGSSSLSRGTERSDARYFYLNRDLNPEQIAELLHGDVVWQASRNGEWTAALRFPRLLDAQLVLPCRLVLLRGKCTPQPRARTISRSLRAAFTDSVGLREPFRESVGGADREDGTSVCVILSGDEEEGGGQGRRRGCGLAGARQSTTSKGRMPVRRELMRRRIIVLRLPVCWARGQERAAEL